MSSVNISALDLNLLVVVDAVLQERSATLAASRLHLTQSAVSNALRRARALFDDPLVVRSGRGFALTPRGESIAPRLAALLEETRALIHDSAGFRPQTSARRFTIACTDAVTSVLLPALLPRFAAALPRAQLRVVTLDAVMTGLERADVDLLIGAPPRVQPGCQGEVLFEDPLVVLARADHPAIGRRLALETYAGLPHAELALFGEPEDQVDRALARHKLRRRIQVTAPHITALPFLVAGSDRVATLIRSVARAYTGSLALRGHAPPLELPPVVIQQIWHRRRDDDAGGALLRELVRGAAKRLGRAR
ncbi:MAG: LysR family transcriptional regulator [Myxococcales bacterium]|nr:LysR family transcriptional regulator [Myxococcales bacterium]